MTDEMLVELAPWLPQWQHEVPKAKARLETGPLVPTRDYEGAARLPTKTVEAMEAKAEENRKLAAESDKAKSRPASS
jgi:alpha-galactosidase